MGITVRGRGSAAVKASLWSPRGPGPSSTGSGGPTTIMSARSIKVAMFAPSMTWGGAEKMFSRLANGFIDAGVSVDLVLANAHGPNLEGLSPAIRVVDLGCRRVLSSIEPLARYLRSARPDAVISTLHYANLAAVLARALSGTSPQLILREATTISMAFKHSNNGRDRALLGLMRRLYPRADVVVTNSRGAAGDLVSHIGVPRSMVRTIYNPAYSAELVPLTKEPVAHPWFTDEGPSIILSVGRLSMPKRYDLLIRAVHGARQERPLRLVVLGDGEERESLEALVHHLDAETWVSLPGFARNPYAYMARADLFVLSSDWEGLPNVLIEAMACGLRVVSTDCPHGPREILGASAFGGERLGRLVAPNDVDALTRAILDELATECNRESLQRRARSFSTERAVQAYLDLVQTARRP